MKKIISATLLKGVNIKLGKKILFGGQQIPSDLIDIMYSEIQEHPHRWVVVYEEDTNLDSVSEKLDDILTGTEVKIKEIPQELKLTKKRKYNKSKSK